MKTPTATACPHCHTTVKLAGPRSAEVQYGEPMGYSFVDGTEWFTTVFGICGECKRLVVTGALGGIRRGPVTPPPTWSGLLWPRTSTPGAVHPDVPPRIRQDFEEAHAVRSFSLRASAALSRRCLQAVLRDKGFRAKSNNLADEINLALPNLPDYIATPIHDVRRVGNFAAHEKLDDTGAVVDVEPEEAEHLLAILDELFDHFYAKPAKYAARSAALNAKDPKTNPANKKPLA